MLVLDSDQLFGISWVRDYSDNNTTSVVPVVSLNYTIYIEDFG
jgi:hypothetical protein